MLGKTYNIETRKKFSENGKGKVSSKKFNEFVIEEILTIYKNKPYIDIANKKKKKWQIY